MDGELRFFVVNTLIMKAKRFVTLRFVGLFTPVNRLSDRKRLRVLITRKENVFATIKSCKRLKTTFPYTNSSIVSTVQIRSRTLYDGVSIPARINRQKQNDSQDY
jgi:hypothetical protein